MPKQGNSHGMYDLSDEEIKIVKEIFHQKKDGESYEDKIIEIIGFSKLNELTIVEGEFAYQFRIIGVEGMHWMITEIIDKGNQEVIPYKFCKYELNEDCNPIIGFKKINSDCVKIFEERKGTISRTQMDSINKVILNNEFWELTPNNSEIRNYDGLLYHGESWYLKGAFAKSYPSSYHGDTTIVYIHEVFRMIPEDSKSMMKIGSLLINETKMK